MDIFYFCGFWSIIRIWLTSPPLLLFPSYHHISIACSCSVLAKTFHNARHSQGLSRKHRPFQHPHPSHSLQANSLAYHLQVHQC